MNKSFALILIQDADMSASEIKTDAFLATEHVDAVLAVAIQAFITGSPNGAMKLQATTNPDPQLDSDWKDLPRSNQLVVGSSDAPFWDLSDQGYLRFRVVYTRSSGSGLLTIRVEGRGQIG